MIAHHEVVPFRHDLRTPVVMIAELVGHIRILERRLVHEHMKPRLHLFGHHHRYSVSERQHVVSIGLEMVTTSYLIFDGKTLAHQRFGT